MQSGKHAVAEGARERGAGRGATGDRDQASAAGWLNFDTAGKNSLNFAAVTPRRICSDVEQIVLDKMTRPQWASAMGRDKYGLWSEFTIEGKAAPRATKTKKSAPVVVPLAPVHQRLRWVPPGRFMMGSPEDEEGRWDGEQLPREVVIDEGFWMFATPCTQALWEAIMPENTSRFRSPGRPVENVSWEECQAFAEKLNAAINQGIRKDEDKLLLSLPTEAKWEYACRAGTTTSTYAGQLEIKGQNNAPLLDAIAWYGGNSGHEFDLENGYDASKWLEKQYPFDKAGTRPVAQKRANPWGLFDMLGNVWEWCADEWVHGRAGEASAARVIRGGSWIYGARTVRAAYRSSIDPADRSLYLGCRLAEFKRGREPSEQRGVSKGSEAEGAERPETAPRRT